jgi:ferric iron reductase protein FhuF
MISGSIQVINFEMLDELRQPPGSRFLDQMGIPAISEDLRRRTCCNRKESNPSRDCGEVL